MPDKTEKIILAAVDYDGALGRDTFETIKEDNPEFIQFILRKIDAARSDGYQTCKIILAIGSNRQNCAIDQYNAEKNGNGSCVFLLPALQQKLNEVINASGRGFFASVEIDEFLMPDIYHNKPPGTTLRLMKDAAKKGRIEKDLHWIFDPKKISNLYTLVQHIASQYPESKVEAYLFDDMYESILLPLNKFFSSRPNLLPTTCSLSLVHYKHGQIESEISSIQGTGEIVSGRQKLRDSLINLIKDCHATNRYDLCDFDAPGGCELNLIWKTNDDIDFKNMEHEREAELADENKSQFTAQYVTECLLNKEIFALTHFTSDDVELLKALVISCDYIDRGKLTLEELELFDELRLTKLSDKIKSIDEQNNNHKRIAFTPIEDLLLKKFLDNGCEDLNEKLLKILDVDWTYAFAYLEPFEMSVLWQCLNAATLDDNDDQKLRKNLYNKIQHEKTQCDNHSYKLSQCTRKEVNLLIRLLDISREKDLRKKLEEILKFRFDLRIDNDFYSLQRHLEILGADSIIEIIQHGKTLSSFAFADFTFDEVLEIKKLVYHIQEEPVPPKWLKLFAESAPEKLQQFVDRTTLEEVQKLFNKITPDAWQQLVGKIQLLHKPATPSALVVPSAGTAEKNDYTCIEFTLQEAQLLKSFLDVIERKDLSVKLLTVEANRVYNICNTRFRRLSFYFHPDKIQHQTETKKEESKLRLENLTACFQSIKDAYESGMLATILQAEWDANFTSVLSSNVHFVQQSILNKVKCGESVSLDEIRACMNEQDALGKTLLMLLIANHAAAREKKDMSDDEKKEKKRLISRLEETVQRTLELKPDIHIKDSNRFDALHHAAQCPHENIIGSLLASGANPLSVDGTGRTAWHLIDAQHIDAQHNAICSQLISDWVKAITDKKSEASPSTPAVDQSVGVDRGHLVASSIHEARKNISNNNNDDDDNQDDQDNDRDQCDAAARKLHDLLLLLENEKDKKLEVSTFDVLNLVDKVTSNYPENLKEKLFLYKSSLKEDIILFLENYSDCFALANFTSSDMKTLKALECNPQIADEKCLALFLNIQEMQNNQYKHALFTSEEVRSLEKFLDDSDCKNLSAKLLKDVNIAYLKEITRSGTLLGDLIDSYDKNEKKENLITGAAAPAASSASFFKPGEETFRKRVDAAIANRNNAPCAIFSTVTTGASSAAITAQFTLEPRLVDDGLTEASDEAKKIQKDVVAPVEPKRKKNLAVDALRAHLDQLIKIGSLNKDHVKKHSNDLINDVIAVGKTVDTDKELQKDLFWFKHIFEEEIIDFFKGTSSYLIEQLEKDAKPNTLLGAWIDYEGPQLIDADASSGVSESKQNTRARINEIIEETKKEEADSEYQFDY